MNKISRCKGLLFILISILLVFTFYKPMVLSNFLIHREYIIKNLCVQKDNQIDCYGKCHLKKMLKTTPQNDDNVLNDLKNIERLFEINVLIEDLINFKEFELGDVKIDNLNYKEYTTHPFLEVKTPPPQTIL